MQDYVVKQKPEDFIVREDSGLELAGKGGYALFRMHKIRYNTENAVQRIAKALGIERKSVGYAGAKDSRAHTWQVISIKGMAKERVLGLNLKDIELEFLGYRGTPVSLGDLQGNSFEITVRNITAGPRSISRIINYFGSQRFGTNNAEVGLAILKKDFKAAAELVMQASERDRDKMRAFLITNRNDYVGALKQIAWKNLTMYIHSYQSKLWNEVVGQYLEKHRAPKIETIPIIGFSTEFEDEELEKMYGPLLARDRLTQADFVIRQIPDLTSAGGERDIFADVKNLKISGLEEDELNPGMKKVLVKFSLGKGSYATEVIKQMFS